MRIDLRVGALVLAISGFLDCSLAAQSRSSPPAASSPGPAWAATRQRDASQLEDPRGLVTAADGDEPSRRFDAGVSLLAPAVWGFRPSGGGAWFTLGSGRTRWQTNYWYARKHDVERDSIDWGRWVTDYLTTDVGVLDSLDVVFSRHFQLAGGIEPHVLAGGGYQRSRSERCYEAISRSGGQVVREHRPPCDGGAAQQPIFVFGVGFDVSWGSRLFLRVQSRGDVGPSEDVGLWWITRILFGTLVVGGGVRF